MTASVIAVALGRRQIFCRVQYQSQILPAYKILALATALAQPLESVILSLSTPREEFFQEDHRNFKAMLRQANETQNLVLVHWKDQRLSLDQMRALGQASLVYRFLWSRLQSATQFLAYTAYEHTAVRLRQLVMFDVSATLFLIFYALYYAWLYSI